MLLHRRGYAGRCFADCIPHDDYRSADFAGPLVPAAIHWMAEHIVISCLAAHFLIGVGYCAWRAE